MVTGPVTPLVLPYELVGGRVAAVETGQHLDIGAVSDDGQLVLVVYGHPQTAGSKSGFAIKAGPKGSQHYTGKVGMRDGKTKASAERHKSWRAAVQEAAEAVMAGRDRLAGPLEVWYTFSLQRPDGHYGTGKNAGRLRASAPLIPDVAGKDGDKLQRSVQDSLADGGVFKNDSQIARWHGAREYARDAIGQSAYGDILSRPGVVIRVRQLLRNDGGLAYDAAYQ